MRARANRAAQAFDDLAGRYDAWYDTASGRMLFDLVCRAGPASGSRSVTAVSGADRALGPWRRAVAFL